MPGETRCSAWTADLNALGFRQVDEAAGEVPDAVDSTVRLVLTRHPATAGTRPVEFEQNFPIRCAVIFAREAERYRAGPISDQQFNAPKRAALLAIAALFRLRVKEPAEDDELARAHFNRLRREASTYAHTVASVHRPDQVDA